MGIETKSKPTTRKYVFIVLSIIIGLFLIFYSLMAMRAPGKKYNALKDEFGFRKDEKSIINDTILTDSTFLSLMREKAFLQARTAIANTDSIYLSINLPDSALILEISGVAVAQTKLSWLSVSRMFYDRNDYVISTMLSKPLNIRNNVASIPKEPLMIKMAPKDTSEFEPDIMPDTADYEPVNFIMEMDNGIFIHIYQEERLNPGDGLRFFLFDLSYRLQDVWSSLKSIISFRIPEYHPFIKIRIPRSYAKIIYRALPEHGQIAVYR